MAPRRPQGGPRRPKDGPKTAQDGPKTPPRRPKTPPRRPQDAPKTPQDAPKRPQPRICFQEGPERPATTSQRTSKRLITRNTGTVTRWAEVLLSLLLLLRPLILRHLFLLLLILLLFLPLGVSRSREGPGRKGRRKRPEPEGGPGAGMLSAASFPNTPQTPAIMPTEPQLSSPLKKNQTKARAKRTRRQLNITPRTTRVFFLVPRPDFRWRRPGSAAQGGGHHNTTSGSGGGSTRAKRTR